MMELLLLSVCGHLTAGDDRGEVMMHKRSFSAWVLAIGLSAAKLRGQVIETVAGTNWSFPSSSLPPLRAPLGAVVGVAIDAQGNVYAADSGNNIVVKITPNGAFTVVAGNGVRGFRETEGPPPARRSTSIREGGCRGLGWQPLHR